MGFVVKNGWLFRYTGNLKVTSLTVPKGVRYIAKDVFTPLKYLKKLVLPEGLWGIGTRSMCDCVSLQEVNFPKSLGWIGSYAFDGCVNLEKVTFSGNIRELGGGSFQNCYSLREVTFTKECRLSLSLRGGCFKDCLSLQNVHISARDCAIDANAFEGCERLRKIQISGRNIRYADIDGVLTNLQKDVLYIYPFGRQEESYTIPATIHTIGERAFHYHRNLKEIRIPENVKYIGNASFYHCVNLENVVISDKVPDIDSNAFMGTKWLENYPDEFVLAGDGVLLYYKGNEKEVIIPEGVKVIKTSSFSYNRKIERIIIPPSVKVVERNCFGMCYVLKQIQLIHKNGKIFTWNLPQAPSFCNIGEILTALIRNVFESLWWIDDSIKYPCILDYWIDTGDEGTEQYIFQNASNFVYEFIQNNDVFHLQRFAESTKYITSENIDMLINKAIESAQKNHSFDVQLYLMDYKAKYLGFADPMDLFKL